MLFEWLRDRQKEQAHAEIASAKEIEDCMANLLIFQRRIPVFSLRALGTSSRGLKKDYQWSDDLEKLPDPSNNYASEFVAGGLIWKNPTARKHHFIVYCFYFHIITFRCMIEL